MKNNFVSVGKILNFHGVQGEAKLGYSKNREDFLAHLKEVYVQQNGEYKKLEISRLYESVLFCQEQVIHIFF